MFHDPVKDGVSVIAIDPEAGNKVIGMRISSVVERQENKDDESEDDISGYSLWLKLVLHCFNLIGTPKSFMDEHPQVVSDSLSG